MVRYRTGRTEKIIIRCRPETKKEWDELRTRLRMVSEDLFVEMMAFYKRYAKRIPLV